MQKKCLEDKQYKNLVLHGLLWTTFQNTIGKKTVKSFQSAYFQYKLIFKPFVTHPTIKMLVSKSVWIRVLKSICKKKRTVACVNL